METQALVFMLLVAVPVAEDRDHDLAELLTSIGNITKDRWDLAFDADANAIDLVSRQVIAATVSSYSYSPFEEMYRIRYRFRVVPQVDENNIGRLNGQLQRELASLRTAARPVPHQEIKSRFEYYPRTVAEWALVLRVGRAETRLRRVPNYAFKGIYVSRDHEMHFRPRTGDALGSAMKDDINAVYALLRPLEPVAYPPVPRR